MYMPSYFEEGEVAVIRGIIADNPLATLVVHPDEGLVANHLPVLFDPWPGIIQVQWKPRC